MTTESLRITFAGDFAPIGFESDGEIQLEKQLIDLLHRQDGFFLNLEAPITESTKRRIKAGSSLKLSRRCIQLLKVLNVNGVSLANNHMFDFGLEGVVDTTEHLENNAIKYWGIGSNKENSWSPFIFERSSIRIAIVSYAEHEFNWVSDSEWCTSMLDPASNVLQIIELSKAVDHIIVYTHIGPENWHYPSPRQVSLFRNFIDAGASVVLNSHSHTIMGMEWYKNKPIYYSLGNFFFPSQNSRASWYNGIMVELILDKKPNPIAVREIPIIFTSSSLALNNDISGFELSFKAYSSNLKDDNLISAKWNEFGEQERKKLSKEVFKGIMAIIIGTLISLFSKRGLVIKFKGLSILRDYTNCENHIENIGNIFNQKLTSKFGKMNA